MQDTTRDGEPESRAALTSFRRHQRIEDPSDQVGRDPFAVVIDPDDDSLPLLGDADPDMRAIAGIDKNCRLIKGQVFLWKANQTWEDLWDLDGAIAQ